MSRDISAIPMPVADLRSLTVVVTALKQAVEVLANERQPTTSSQPTRQVVSAAIDSGSRNLDQDGFYLLNTPTFVQPLTVPIDTVAASRGRYVTSLDNAHFEFAYQQSMTVQTGQIPNGAAWGNVVGRGGDGKVLRFGEVLVKPGGGTSWVDDTVLELAAGATASAISSELDIDNRAYHAGDADGISGIYPSLATPPDNVTHPRVVVGQVITGAGNYRSTAAHMISGVRFDPDTGQAFGDLFNRGYTVQGGTKQHCFATYANSTRAFRDTGTHALGVDLSAASYTLGAIGLKASTQDPILSPPGDRSGSIYWATSSAVTGAITCGPDAAMLLDAQAVTVNGACVPKIDNTYTLGNASFRWSQVWVVDGTIHTSDPSTKTDVAEITSGVAERFIMSLRPVSYRLIETHDLVEGDVEFQVPETDADGNEIVDHVPALDANGNQVTQPVRLRSATVLDAQGRPMTSTRSAPIMKMVPRLRTVTYKRELPVKRSGRRLHTGLMSDHVRDASAAAFGETTGVYVSPGDGPDGIRYDEVIAPLIALVQDLFRRVAELESKPAITSSQPTRNVG